MTTANEYIQNFWTTANGLPQNSVNAVLQTRDGYLWLGTFGGLARFDGVKFTVFDVAEPQGIKSNRILSLCESKDGGLWIGTSNAGLMRYKDGAFSSVPIPGGQPEDLVSIIYEDSQGALWMKTSRGLVRFLAGEFKTLTPRDGLPNATITSLAEDQDKNFWDRHDSGPGEDRRRTIYNLYKKGWSAVRRGDLNLCETGWQFVGGHARRSCSHRPGNVDQKG